MAIKTQSSKVGELDSKQKEVKKNNQSKKEVEVVGDVYLKFSSVQSTRNAALENFDGLTLTEYIEDSYRRYNTNVDLRDDIEDWQSAIHDPFTRNKVNAILGKIVSVLPVAEVRPRGDEDRRKSLIVSNLYEYSEDIDDYEDNVITLLLEAIVKGTGIGYEGQVTNSKKVRNVTGSGDTIKVSEKTIKQNKLFTKVVKLEDFYPVTLGVRKIKDLPACFWRDKKTHSSFINEYSYYAKSALVEPHRTVYGDREDKPYYFDYISKDVLDGEVEILNYYDKINDQFVVIANGVWLNPLIINGEEVVSPLPFNHKELPFFDIRFELFGSDFFYGKSLPDKLKNLQDVLNVLTNMLMDQSFLTIFPPILTNGFDSLEDDYLRPGRRTPVDTQGLPINQAFMKLDLGTPSGWHQYILEYTRKIMEESSMDKVSQGIAGTGDRTTAQEIRVAADGVSSMLGLFGRWVKYGVKEKAKLRIKNILQFWTDKESPIIEEILGEGGTKEMKDAFNTVKISGTVLSNGKRGTKIIEMYREKAKMPTKVELQNRAALQKISSNETVEYVAIDPDYLRNLDFDIKLVPSPRNEMSKDIEKALSLEKIRVYLSFFPDMVDKEELLANLAETLGDDPAKIMKKDIISPPPPTDNPMADTGVNTQPQGNVANNAMRGAMGGDQGGNAMVALQNQVTG